MFLWLIYKNTTFTWDNLQKGGRHDPNICILFNQGEESVEHLFIECVYTNITLENVYNLGDNPNYKTLGDFRNNIKKQKNRKDNKGGRMGSWHLQVERNNRIFNNINIYVFSIAMRIHHNFILLTGLEPPSTA